MRESKVIALRKTLQRPLDQFVDCLWYSNGEPRPYEKERLLPTGCVDLIFKLREDRSVRVYDNENDTIAKSFGGAVVSGAYSRHFEIDSTQPAPTIGIHFRPGGAAPFLGLPLSEIMDQHIGLDELWGRKAAAVRERLLEAASVAAMFKLLEQTLFDRLAEPSGDFRAMAEAVGNFASPAAPSVKAVRDSMGFSAKRFIRSFQESVGLTPKLFCRIQRFQSVLDRMAGGEQVPWVNLALDNGYYDQPHLIRDFREFTGVTPREYRPVKTGQKNHIVPNI